MSTYDDGFNDGLSEGLQICTDFTTYLADTSVKSWLYGNMFAGILYGTIVFTVIAYLRILVIHVKGENPPRRQQWTPSIHVAGTFVLSTLQIGGALQNTAKGLHKFGCMNTNSGIFSGSNLLENVCFMLTAWTVDMIMMWRFLSFITT
ncbi:hypothetical protein BDQ17DRAFT_1437438 [Cyathus striatus]|nr:hypothetical protein BDQ17DRAFT_1437438 [Cyathus striatus]